MTYLAYQVQELDGTFIGDVKTLETPALQEDHILIKVEYSSLNYKDALAGTGVKGVVKQ